MRIGPRHDRHCEKITTADGREIPWVHQVRYLGIFIVRSTKFRAANGIFANDGRLASEEVIIELLKHKCLPVLLYGLEVCALDKRAL